MNDFGAQPDGSGHVGGPPTTSSTRSARAGGRPCQRRRHLHVGRRPAARAPRRRDLRWPRRARQQRRDPARPDARQHDRGRVGRRHQGPPQGHVRLPADGRGRTGASGPRPATTNDARIINTTSVSGIFGTPGQTNYGAAKAGIAGFTIIAADGARPLRRDRQRHRRRSPSPG